MHDGTSLPFGVSSGRRVGIMSYDIGLPAAILFPRCHVMFLKLHFQNLGVKVERKAEISPLMLRRHWDNM